MGNEVGHLAWIQAVRQGAAHVGHPAQVLGQGRRGADRLRRLHRRGSLVRQRGEDPDVGEVELRQAQLGERDHAGDPLVVAHGDDDHRLLQVVRARDRHAAGVGVGVGNQEGPAVGSHPAGEALTHLEAQVLQGDRLVAVLAGRDDGHQRVGLLEDVDAAGVVVDDRPDLVGHGLGDLADGGPAGHAGRSPLGDLQLGDPALRGLLRLVHLRLGCRELGRSPGDLLAATLQAHNDEAQGEADRGECDQLHDLDRDQVDGRGDAFGDEHGAERDGHHDHPGAGRQRERGQDQGDDGEGDGDVPLGEPDGRDHVEGGGRGHDQRAVRAQEPLAGVAQDSVSHHGPGALRARRSVVIGQLPGTIEARGFRGVGHARILPSQVRRRAGAEVPRGCARSYPLPAAERRPGRGRAAPGRRPSSSRAALAGAVGPLARPVARLTVLRGEDYTPGARAPGCPAPGRARPGPHSAVSEDDSPVEPGPSRPDAPGAGNPHEVRPVR